MITYSFPRSDEEERATNGVWFKGHTDFGSLTVLWSQPVASLQILTSAGTWKHIKHVDNALVSVLVSGFRSKLIAICSL